MRGEVPSMGVRTGFEENMPGGGGCALFQPGGSSLSLGTLTGAEPHWEFRAGPACALCWRNATQLISP